MEEPTIMRPRITTHLWFDKEAGEAGRLYTSLFKDSWQIMFMGDRPIGQKITPTLMFVGSVCGKAEEAINFYTSVFHDWAGRSRSA
jgi:predicted 3-demethylubiquinone-9 3-methyltransferase (glyoxalase superfamily)